MIRFVSSLVIVILWIVLLNRTFPSNHEDVIDYIIPVAGILLCWIIGGILFRVSGRENPSVYLFVVFTFASCFLIYELFPWYAGYTGIQVIKDYSNKRKSTEEIQLSWIYSLPQQVENFPLISMAQRKFAHEVKPDKCYLLQCFYYDSSQVQQYADRYIIYLKDNVPLTTSSTSAFSRAADGTYYLAETVDGKMLAFITVKGNTLRIKSAEQDRLLDPDSGPVYFSEGKYKCELKITDAYNGFNVGKAYWIYKFLQ